MKKIQTTHQSYHPSDTKKVTITFDTPRFTVIRESDKKIMYRDNTRLPSGDDESGDTVKIGDFSYLNEIGLYYIKATDKDGNTEESDPFVIALEPSK